MSAEKQENRRVVLIGDPFSKRSVFFRKAADSLGIAYQEAAWEEIFDWNVQEESKNAVLRNLQRESKNAALRSLQGEPQNAALRSLQGEPQNAVLRNLQGAAVKIDPPGYQTVRLCQMQEQLKAYQRSLQFLARADCRFLNHPEMICRMLDKRDTNLWLKARGIPVTEMFPEEIRTADQLEAVMEQKHCYSVFIKPRYFSGAAGVAAFRLHPGLGRRKLYTSCRLEQGQLINTKKLVCMEENTEISRFLNQLLSLECVVERWHPKADFHGKSYDLRVVFQFGHIAAMIARQSKGPITNLHLNNQALDTENLGLSEAVMDQITAVCREAYEAFSVGEIGNGENSCVGISMAGIDLLLEKGTLRPRVIEMNGQGDLIYRDIYGKNRIYREQARILAGQAKDAEVKEK